MVERLKKQIEVLRQKNDELTAMIDLLSNRYLKILRANITTDAFVAVKMEDTDQVDPVFATKLSEWTANAAESGIIYDADVEAYRKFTDRKSVAQRLKKGEKSLIHRYRRQIGDAWRWVKMEIVPAPDYRDESQSVIIYISDVTDAYNTSQEAFASAKKMLDEAMDIEQRLATFEDDAKGEVDIVLRGAMELVTRFIVVDLEADTYRYILGMDPILNKIGRAGKYEDFISYYTSCVKDIQMRTDLYRFLRDLKDTLGNGNRRLQTECTANRGKGDTYELLTVFPLNRVEGKVQRALFIVQDITEIRQREIDKQGAIRMLLRREREQRGIYQVLARLYNAVYYVKIERHTYQTLVENANFERLIPEYGDYEEAMALYLDVYVDEAVHDRIWEFVSLDTLAERLARKPVLEFDYRRSDDLLIRTIFVAADALDGRRPSSTTLPQNALLCFETIRSAKD